MRSRLPYVLVTALLLAAAAPALAQYDSAAERGSHRLRDMARGEEEGPSNASIAVNEMTQQVEDAIQGFAERVNERILGMASGGLKTWATFVALLGFGLVAMLIGWSLLKSFTVPFAPVWGLILGGATSYFIVAGLAEGSGLDRSVRLGIIGTGAFAGIALLMFTALKAKPIAAMLVIMTPFVVGASFLFSVGSVAGLVVLIIGFLAGFGAMIEMRPLAILSTSFAGAISLFLAYGLLAHAVSLRSEAVPFLLNSFTWLLNAPLMFLLAIAVVTILGINFQHSTGPRGTLEV